MSNTDSSSKERVVEVVESTSEQTEKLRKKTVNPIVILLGILVFAASMTYVVDSGSYDRDGRKVIPSSYQKLEKEVGFGDLFAVPSELEPGTAEPVGVIGMMETIPEGLEKMASLIFMVMIIGGMFGILNHSGAIEAGLEKLLNMVRGNIYVLVPILMVVFSAGSTFLGLATEYLLVIPLMVVMANRLGLPNVIGLAIVTVAVKAGYLSSVTNPIPLSIAQPLVGLQVFSGSDVRFWYYLVFLAIGIAFVLLMIRRSGFKANTNIDFGRSRLAARHLAVLVTLLLGIVMLVYGSNRWLWSHEQLSTYYLSLCIFLSIVGGLGASEAAGAFVSGMKKTLLASFLIGVASAVALTLQQGQILDTIVHSLTSMIGTEGATLAAMGMFVSQLLLDFLIPSTSGQAAISMPIMGPIGQLTGVSPQTTVLAFLFGNGITNVLTPTSGTLLAYLATAQVNWSEWARFVLPLWLCYIVVAMVLIAISVAVGF